MRGKRSRIKICVYFLSTGREGVDDDSPEKRDEASAFQPLTNSTRGRGEGGGYHPHCFGPTQEHYNLQSQWVDFLGKVLLLTVRVKLRYNEEFLVPSS
jgi:hypothetical protein